MSNGSRSEGTGGVAIGPRESFHVVTGIESGLNFIVDHKIDLADPVDRKWLISKLEDVSQLPFKAEELQPILLVLTRYLHKDWLTVYGDGIIKICTGPKIFNGFHLFNHLIPLGKALLFFEGASGFRNLVSKLNRDTYERLSTLLETFTAARYASAGYEVEIEPSLRGKSPDFRVRLKEEWVYFECKRINVGQNLYFRKNQDFVSKLEHELTNKFKTLLPENYLIDVRFDKKPTATEVERIEDDLRRMISDSIYSTWVKDHFGVYALMPRKEVGKPEGYSSRAMEFTIGTTPTPISPKLATAVVSHNPYGSKLEQKFRNLLKQARRQIPSECRGIIVIQGLNEAKAQKILQERLGQPEYNNIIAGLAIGNGVKAVRRDDQTDVDFDFIGKCVNHSLFYGLDLGNH